MPVRGHKARRTCLGCRKSGDQEELVRYVLSPEGHVLVDYRGKLPGRGAYTCIDSGCVAEAVRRGGFGRAFKGLAAAQPSAEKLTGELADQLQARVVALLGMARKSGVAVSGSNLVLKALDAGSIRVVLMAEDISSGIGAKVASKAASGSVPCHRLLSKGRMGQVLGKGERSVVALQKSSLAETIEQEILRYEQIVGES